MKNNESNMKGRLEELKTGSRKPALEATAQIREMRGVNRK